MPSVHVRPFKRDDREQLTALVNAHIGAVVPGWAVSVNAVMAQMEREPGEFVIDPWVTERTTLVAIERDHVVAGAHLKRYGTGEEVGEALAGSGEIAWLVCWPSAAGAGDSLAAACHTIFDAWAVPSRHADGSLPSPATYGVPDCWPHIRGVYERAGFRPTGRTEIVMVADVGDLPTARDKPALAGLAVHREVGLFSTRFAAICEGVVVGFAHVRADLTNGGALSRLAGWGDVWELHVEEAWRRRGVATWLVAHAADWLRLAHVDRLIDQCWSDELDRLGFLRQLGWRELARTDRWWEWAQR